MNYVLVILLSIVKLVYTSNKVYLKATSDPVFKHIFSKGDIRNQILSDILKIKIVKSELIDPSLNPIKTLEKTRRSLNDQSLARDLQNYGNEQIFVPVCDDDEKSPKYRSILSFTDLIKAVSIDLKELKEFFPDEVRATQLDILCETDSEFINVEVQVKPQNFWDIRIFAHASGLFSRQFSRGFEWSSLEESKKIRRVVGISFLSRGMTNPKKVADNIAWYNAAPWNNKNEYFRHYKMQTIDGIQRPGIEFYDFNLAAADKSRVCEPQLCEWLTFFGKSDQMDLDYVETAVISPAVKSAYKLIERTAADKDLVKEVDKFETEKASISFFVDELRDEARSEGKAEGIAEGKAEGKAEGIAEGKAEAIADLVRKMVASDYNNEEVAQVLGISVEDVNQILN